MKAKIVVGLGFGDEGKGMTTSSLCLSDKYKIVVRFSGGQQAGHTVYNNETQHICSNYGAGVLSGIPTYFTEHTTVYPNTIYRETLVLREKGIETPTLIVHPLTKITTPSDVAYNRVMERKKRHGSCGLGVGATMDRNINTGYKLYCVDIETPKIFEEKLKNISNYYKSKLFDKDDIIDFTEIEAHEMKTFIDVYNSSFIILNYNHLKLYEEIIFEGSQGILLDMDHGIFPNVTYSNTTSKNALDICVNKLGMEYNDIEIFYITRCYQTRHGNGWVSNDNNIVLQNFYSETNETNDWQGNFRVREIDYDLLEYSFKIDDIYSENVENKNIVITCLDQRPGFEFNYNSLNPKIKRVYTSDNPFNKSYIL
jgi:adenylosuccinate synthase